MVAMSKKIGVPFSLISDPQLEAIRSFGVLEAEHDIAVPAIFILNQDGQTVWREVGEAIQDRVNSKELMRVLKELRQSGKLQVSSAPSPAAAAQPQTPTQAPAQPQTASESPANPSPSSTTAPKASRS